MKKLFKIVGLILLLLVAFLIAAPFLFKGKIQEAIINSANENLNAQVAFSDIDLSLFKNFPNLSVKIEDFTVDGVDEFEGVRMADIKDLFVTVNLASLFSDEYQIKSIQIKEPKFDIRVTKDGKANYDIAKESGESEDEGSSTEASVFNIALQKYTLKNGEFKYSDESIPMFMHVENINHEGKGDFTADQTLLETETSIDHLNFEFEGVKYIKNAKVDLDADLDLDQVNSVYTFKENQLKFNELVLNADGFVAMPTENIEMDIKFGTEQTDFKHLLSMVPASFASDLSGVDVAGQMNVEGFVKGVFGPTSMPAFGLDLMVDKGRFNYPDLPKSVESIFIDAHLASEGGPSYDNTVVNIPKFYMEIAENPIDIKLNLSNPMTDPTIDCDVRAKVLLDHLKDAVPLEEGDALEGSLIADISIHGKQSDVESENYESIEAKGELDILNILYKSDSLPYDLQIDQAYFDFTSQYMSVDQFKSSIGNSDLQATGKIDNYIAFILSEETLIGSFDIQSNKMDLNEFMTDESSTEISSSDSSSTEEMAAIELPGNIDFKLNANFKDMKYGDIEMENVGGTIHIVDKKAHMSGLRMDILDGTIIMDGIYDSNDIEQPTMDLDLDMNNINIQKSAEMFYTIDKLAPIAKSCTGSFSTDMKLIAILDENMEPIEESLLGSGSLQTNQVYVEKFEPLNEIARVLGIDRLSKQTIEDVNLSYEIKDGKAIVNPFKVKVDGMEAEIHGSTTLYDQRMDYHMDMDIPFEKFPSGLANQAGSLVDKINSSLGSNLSTGDKVPVKLRIQGTMEKPDVKSNYGEVAKDATSELIDDLKEEVKEEVQEVIEEAKDDAKEKAREEADKILADAQKESDKLLTDAKKAADKAKEEAYKEADEVENSYKNLLEKAGKKVAADGIRAAADKAHDKAMEEAQKQADKIMEEARKQADDKINSVE